MLQCVHAAWARNQYQREKVAQKAEKRPLPLPSAKIEEFHDLNLGLELLFSLIDIVRDPECDPNQRRLFLDEVVPVIRELPPLSLFQPGKLLKNNCLKRRPYFAR